MSSLLLTLSGAVVLSVVAEVLIPDGSSKKYAKLAIGIAVSCVILSPIVSFFGGEIEEIPTPAFGEGYIQTVESQYDEVISTALQMEMQKKGYEITAKCMLQNGEIESAELTAKTRLEKSQADAIGKTAGEILSISLEKIKIKTELQKE